ncbi:MAG: hypothetical protein J6Y02_16450 [Pseudobutyrivibrio sp.]|nr:hypothetical protein [Pseudobutyrivibrio sp.]
MDKYLVIICLAAVILLLSGFYIYGISKKPKEEQLEALKFWLRKLVWEAEDYFGSKTGQLKLAYVYNMAVKEFPWIAKYMSYEEFDEKFVKEALKWLEKQLAENPAIKQLIEK